MPSTATGSRAVGRRTGPIKTASRIDVPSGAGARRRRRRRRRRMGTGPRHLAGRGAGRRRRLGRVRPRPRRPATRRGCSGGTSGPPTPGSHRLRVRATDGDGEVQTMETAPPAPDGASGYHSRTVRSAEVSHHGLDQAQRQDRHPGRRRWCSAHSRGWPSASSASICCSSTTRSPKLRRSSQRPRPGDGAADAPSPAPRHDARRPSCHRG